MELPRCQAISWAALDAVPERLSPPGVELRLTSENFDGSERRQLHAVGVAGSRRPRSRRAIGSARRKASEAALGDLRSPLGRGTSRAFVDESAEWMLSRLLDAHPVAHGKLPIPAMTELPMDAEQGSPARRAGVADGFAMGARRARRGSASPGVSGRLIARQATTRLQRDGWSSHPASRSRW